MNKITFVKQRDSQDCGACCIKSIVMYYGGSISVEKIRIDTKTSHDGITALDIIKASNNYGFETEGLKFDDLDSNLIVYPCIAHIRTHNNLYHFVVIYKVTDKYVLVMDPDKGILKMPKNSFYDIWTEVLIMFYPQNNIIKMDKNNNLLLTLFKIITKDKNLIIELILSSLLITITTLLSSYYFKFSINSISANFLNMKIIVFIFLIVLCLKIIFIFIRDYLENYLIKNIDVYLLSSFIDHIFRIPSKYILSRKSGEVITRVNELSSIKELYTDIFIAIMLDSLLVILSIPLLIMMNFYLFLVLFIMVILLIIIGIVSAKVLYKKIHENILLNEEFNTSLIENINAYSSIKNLNITKYSLKKIEISLSKLLYNNFLLKKFITIINTLKTIVNDLGLFIINSIGFYLIYMKYLDIASLITFNTLLVFFLSPIKNLIDILPKYYYLKATFDKINEFSDLEEEKMDEKRNYIYGDIVISKLSYSYNGVYNILNNINIKIKKNKMTLLNGKSGCGKSTLCKIINNEIDDYKGLVKINNINLKDISKSNIKDNIVYVSQNECIFTDTIKNNIVLDKKISYEEFYKICKICLLEDIVKNKPLRYETLVSEEYKLSGGEKQRIILARALLKKRNYIILDEALSEVDLKTEFKILDNIKKEFLNKTIIYISHKKTKYDFDEVINL